MKRGPKPFAFKICPACKTNKARSEYYKKGDTVSHCCKPCSLADHKTRKHLYKETQRIGAKRWRNHKYKTDPVYREKISQAKKARYNRIKDELNAKRRETWANDPYSAAHRHNRNHDVKNSRPDWADRAAILAFYAACPDGCHVDHIIPLKGIIDGDRVCGLHIPINLQYLPIQENRKKYNRVSRETLLVLQARTSE